MLRKIKANIPSGSVAIALIGLLLSASIWGYAIGHVRDEASAAVKAEISKNENLVLALEEQTIRIIKNIDQLLLIIKDQVQQNGSSAIVGRLLAGNIIDTKMVTFASVANANGRGCLGCHLVGQRRHRARRARARSSSVVQGGRRAQGVDLSRVRRRPGSHDSGRDRR